MGWFIPVLGEIILNAFKIERQRESRMKKAGMTGTLKLGDLWVLVQQGEGECVCQGDRERERE